MRIDLDAQVRTRDGEEAGSVERAVVNPETGEITDFVIRTGGLLGRKILVPREELEKASRDGDSLRLRLSKDDLKDAPDYIPANYGMPPAGWIPPLPYGYPSAAYLWPTAYACAYAPQACEPPETGAREGAKRPPLEIDKGALVLDREGEEVGVVDDVVFDPKSGDLRGLVIRVGGALQTLLGGGKTVEVPGEQIDRIEQNVVHLRTERDKAA